VHLERLIEALAETPARAETVGLVPAQDQALARNVDAAVRWHGARATDILKAVRRALA
jgi:hypothetical protein